MDNLKSALPDKEKKISANLTENVEELNRLLGVNKSFDMIHRSLHYAGKDFALYFVDGFAKDSVLNQIMNHLSKLQSGKLNHQTIKKLLETEVGYLEVNTESNVQKLISTVLAGPLLLLVDGEEEALVIDAREYPARGPQEPDIERVVRGARDGFVETLIFNTALTRRRVRDSSLRMEYIQVGKRSKTDICLSYIEDIADPELVEKLRTKLQKIEIDGLPMAEKTVEEYVFKQHWNPFPLVRYTERPDVAAVHLLEGHVLIYVDTSPSVMIAPSTLFHHVQHAEEYRQKPIIGAYLRWVRFLAMLVSVFLLPLWFLAYTDPSLLPDAWRFLTPENKAHLSIFWQLIIVDVGVDILRMAAIHTPSPLATALGLVAAIILGQMAVDIGLLTQAVILYIALATIGNFATPSYELSLANKMVRLILLILIYWFHLAGFILGVVALFVLLLTTKSIHVPYLWPLIPFNARAFMHILVRSPVPSRILRPKIIAKGDPDRQPKK